MVSLVDDMELLYYIEDGLSREDCKLLFMGEVEKGWFVPYPRYLPSHRLWRSSPRGGAFRAVSLEIPFPDKHFPKALPPGVPPRSARCEAGERANKESGAQLPSNSSINPNLKRAASERRLSVYSGVGCGEDGEQAIHGGDPIEGGHVAAVCVEDVVGADGIGG